MSNTFWDIGILVGYRTYGAPGKLLIQEKMWFDFEIWLYWQYSMVFTDEKNRF